MAVCRSCGAPIVWAVTDKGKRIPLDAEADGDRAAVVPGANLARAEHPSVFVVRYVAAGLGKFVTHFATCPNALSHRKRS